jgi:hypothetical protein
MPATAVTRPPAVAGPIPRQLMFPNAGPGVGVGDAEAEGTGLGAIGDGGKGEGGGSAARVLAAATRTEPQRNDISSNARCNNDGNLL